MARYGYTRFLTPLDGSSANSSIRTSNPVWIGDASIIGVMYSSTTIAASVVSIDASFSDGYQSVLTTTAAPNVDWVRYSSLSTNPSILNTSNLTLGPRWLRFIRAATDSQASVVVAYRAS